VPGFCAAGPVSGTSLQMSRKVRANAVIWAAKYGNARPSAPLWEWPLPPESLSFVTCCWFARVAEPAGRALFAIDPSCDPGSCARFWPLLGQFPRSPQETPEIHCEGNTLKIRSLRNGIKSTVEIALAGEDAAELWTIRVENSTCCDRSLKLVPYLEWVLNTPGSDRGHTQYNRLYPEMEFVAKLQAVLAWHKQSKVMGFLAADPAPEGFLTSRIDFIGRAQSIASPRSLQTLAFLAAEDAGVSLARLRKTIHSIRHGEVAPGTPQPYFEYMENGRKLLVRTPLTPRPFDHTMSNARGHVVAVTNRGLHTSSNGNSQQNRLTPDWPDTATREVPGEAFYLYDIESRRWYSPTHHPLNDAEARYEAEFGVDGTTTYRMTHKLLSTELTVFVPPEDPAGVYLLTIRNHEDVARRIRLAPYFQIVLADQPENAGPLQVRYDWQNRVLYFENPRNEFRTGPAFVSLSAESELIETQRGRFFGAEPDVANPFMLREGIPDRSARSDRRPVAVFMTMLEIPPNGHPRLCAIQ
jgi:cyclic beta-1,2-glucan synthetase